jgi:folate-dependent phosphoribosylglycinamide formyltransferase PurN
LTTQKALRRLTNHVGIVGAFVCSVDDGSVIARQVLPVYTDEVLDEVAETVAVAFSIVPQGFHTLSWEYEDISVMARRFEEHILIALTDSTQPMKSMLAEIERQFGQIPAGVGL